MNSREDRATLWLLALVPLVLAALHRLSLSPQESGGMIPWLLALPGPVLALLGRGASGALRTALLTLLWLLNGAAAGLSAYQLRHYDLSWARMCLSLLGLMYLFLGSRMGTVKPNGNMGIRTRWTLTDPDVWNRTHRLSGWLLFLSGLLVLFGSVLFHAAITLLLLAACSVVCLAVPAAMSRVWYRRLHPEQFPRP